MQNSTEALPFLWGTGHYIIKHDNLIQEFDHWDKIPDAFDHLIKFLPQIPAEPHTPEQHVLIDSLPGVFSAYLARQLK